VPEKWEAELEAGGTSAAVIAETARMAAGVNAVEAEPGKVYLARTRTDDGGEVISIEDMEMYSAAPRRRSGTARLDRALSFIDYTKEFKGRDTRVYADIRVPEIVAVFNDDTSVDDSGAWRDHRAILRLQRTPEWERWLERDTVMGTQVEFAEHLELCLRDIAVPAAADLIEIARSFTASNSIQFRSAQNLANGETRFAYDEEVSASAGPKQNVEVPREFRLMLSPFRGGEVVEITARLRYRLANGVLKIGYILDGTQEVEENAFAFDLDLIEERTEITPLWGRPADSL
jgi:uncharacterized protein YfdQ (DUF2303 family)